MISHDMEFYNVEELADAPGGGLALRRIPSRVSETLNQGAAVHRSINTCGCEIRFNMEDEEVQLFLRRDVETSSPFGIGEVYFGSFQAPYGITPQMIGKDTTVITIRRKDVEASSLLQNSDDGLFDRKLVRVLLPYDSKTYFVDKQGQTSPPLPAQAPARRYLAYGSSITHGGDAVRPSGTYAMRLANMLNMDLINLGFAGSAQMEPSMAEYIAERKDWQIATIEMGINVIGQWSAAKFKDRVDRFVDILARDLGDRSLFVTDLYLCKYDLENDPLISEYRAIVKNAVECAGQTRLHYIAGTELLASVEELTADLIHPSAAGQEAIARRWDDFIRSQMS
ncbi:hypothetical protein KP806_26535 [Paenibacillus sp. N4]|uniref:SGNH/GDSL hydrolase family protein n=1 Tax=Paenibacillus vietnamensis TaxID=2590547 RepID=UPI001CD08C68|nr:SGNH/GDSL hydrolase family protein [Paenibacillus vietnamensis]MCA0758617.1 hypothetical protein [Paenibacillus vietnamensis]